MSFNISSYAVWNFDDDFEAWISLKIFIRFGKHYWHGREKNCTFFDSDPSSRKLIIFTHHRLRLCVTTQSSPFSRSTVSYHFSAQNACPTVFPVLKCSTWASTLVKSANHYMQCPITTTTTTTTIRKTRGMWFFFCDSVILKNIIWVYWTMTNFARM